MEPEEPVTNNDGEMYIHRPLLHIHPKFLANTEKEFKYIYLECSILLPPCNLRIQYYLKRKTQKPKAKVLFDLLKQTLRGKNEKRQYSMRRCTLIIFIRSCLFKSLSYIISYLYVKL
jgi:hypothetical protein